MSENAQPARCPVSAARLEGLDGLRGIAALSVFWFHIVVLIYPEGGLEGRGYLAVDFFFMLSGYVMARTYEHRFAVGYGTWRFMSVRYRKLWPFMAVGALLGAPIVALQLEDPLRTLQIVAANVLLLPMFNEGALYPVNVAAWSIFAELVANLLHGFFLWRLPNRVLALLCLGMIPLVGWIAITHGGLAVGAETATAHLGIARALLPYMIGILLWRWWRDRPTISINPVLAFLALPVFVLALPAAWQMPWFHDFGFALLVCPALIAGGLAYRGSSAAMRWIGLISFPLYAINLPILLWSKALGLGVFVGVGFSLLLANYLAVRSRAPRVPRASLRSA